MPSRVAYYFAALTIILMHNMIFPVKGQSTAPVCEYGDLSNGIVTQQTVDAIHRLNIQIQSIFEHFSELFQHLKNQQDVVLGNLQAVDQRSQKQEQDMKNLNVSLQQRKNQLNTSGSILEAIDRRLREKDISIRNQTQNLWKLAIAFSAALPGSIAVSATYEAATVSTTVASHIKDRPSFQGTRVWPSGLFPSSLVRPDGSLIAGVPALLRLRRMMSLMLLCLACRPNPTYGSDLGEFPILQSTVNGWIVLMSRFDGSLNFNRSWAEYKNGFGDIGRGEFWLGNEKIHRLTKRYFYRLHTEVQLKSNGQWYYADYDTLSIDSEGSKYTLRLSGFSGGTAGDSLTNTSVLSAWYHGGMSFSTFDADNDRDPRSSCAQGYNGGWWFNECHLACLTCPYNSISFRWGSLHHVSLEVELRAARMMIKSK